MDNLNKVYNDLIIESYIKKIQKYVENFECACISASRNKLINVTNNTIIDNKQVGDSFTKEENRHRNTALKSCLLKLGYGVTSLDGRFAEAGGNIVPGKETSYFVVNLNNDPNFYKNLFMLSEKFNQDAFLYKPNGTMSAILVGTNLAERNEEWGTPGYNQTINAGEFNPNGFEGALSKMGNKAFQFRLNPDTNQTNTFIGNEILSEETFNKLSIIQKDGCTRLAKKYI